MIFESLESMLYAVARDTTVFCIYFTLAMLGLYFLALILSYIMLISPGMEKRGKILLFASIILPLVAIMSVSSEVERFFLSLIDLLETYSPWSFILVFLAAWLTITLLLYGILRDGSPLNNSMTRLLPPIVGAYAALHLNLFIYLAGIAFASYAVLGLLVAVLFFHFYITRYIIRSARKVYFHK